MADEICHEYRASRSRKAAWFLMRLCASHYAERQIYLTLSIYREGTFTLSRDKVFPIITKTVDAATHMHHRIHCVGQLVPLISFSHLPIRQLSRPC